MCFPCDDGGGTLTGSDSTMGADGRKVSGPGPNEVSKPPDGGGGRGRGAEGTVNRGGGGGLWCGVGVVH